MTVSTWQEFVTAVGTSGAEVELDADIDMNEVMPGGVTESISVSCSSIDGKGHKIHGISADNIERVFYLDTVSTIKDLHFIDFYLTNAVLFRYPNSRNLKFDNCTFSGRMQRENSSSNNTGIFRVGDLNISDITMTGCAFSLDTVGDVHSIGFYQSVSWRPSHYSPTLKYCNIYINSLNCTSNNYNKFTLYDSQVTGSFSGGVYAEGARSVINADVSGGKADSAYGNSSVIINSDKIAQGVNVSYLKQVTDEQMRDAEYLNSIGFPCGVM